MYSSLSSTFALYAVTFIWTLFANLNGPAHAMTPCNNMTSDYYPKGFLKKSLTTFHQNIDDFFGADLVKACRLRYIDMHKMRPKDPEKNMMWIVYAGDSLLHELWIGARQALSGHNPSLDPKEALDQLDTPWSNHLGPRTEENISPHGYPNDPELLMCCRVGMKTSLGEEHGDSCIFAGHKHQFLRNELPEAMEKYSMFLYDDSSAYIDTFVKPMFLGENFNCISYIWAKEFNEARNLLVRFDHKKTRPDAFVFNMGTHEYGRPLERIAPYVNGFLKAASYYVKTAPAYIILHSATSVLYPNDAERNRLLNPIIQQYNSFISNMVKGAPNLQYLDLWGYDLAMSALPGCKRDDGVHFEKICNYQALYLQWDMNWLMAMGLIAPAQYQ